MRIKVDENIGQSGVDLLRQAGHDVMTVREQGLAGSRDELVFQACKTEARTLEHFLVILQHSPHA